MSVKQASISYSSILNCRGSSFSNLGEIPLDLIWFWENYPKRATDFKKRQNDPLIIEIKEGRVFIVDIPPPFRKGRGGTS